MHAAYYRQQMYWWVVHAAVQKRVQSIQTACEHCGDGSQMSHFVFGSKQANLGVITFHVYLFIICIRPVLVMQE